MLCWYAAVADASKTCLWELVVFLSDSVELVIVHAVAEAQAET